MSAIDNALAGQPTTRRPGGKPPDAGDSTLPAPEQPFDPRADAGVDGSSSTRQAPGVSRDDKVQGAQPGRARSDADPLGDNSEYSNGAGSNAS